MTTERLAIGVDVGATKIAGVVADEQGRVLVSERRPTAPERGETAVIHTIGRLIQTLAAQAPGPVAGIGLTAPGQVNSLTGTVRQAANMGWDEVHLLRDLRPLLSAPPPLFLIRDSFAEVLGEAYFGAGQGCADLVYLGLGSGLGSGVISGGRLLSGATFNAAEIGHLSLDVNGRLCNCGLRGCAETLVSGNGVLATTRDWLRANRYPTSLVDDETLTAHNVLAAAAAGDGLAMAVLAESARWLGQVIAAYAIILNPARIVIGGGFGKAAFPLLLPGAKQELSRRALAMNRAQLEIVPSTLASSALGASCLVWYAEARP